MTGIGYSSNRGAVSVTIRGLNARHTEVSVKVPTQLEHLEHDLRKRLTAAVFRGKVDCVIRLDGSSSRSPVVADRALFDSINHALVTLIPDLSAAERREFALSHAARLAIKVADESVELSPNIEKTVERGFSEALKSFLASREREGRVLAADMKRRLKDLKSGAARVGRRAKVLAAKSVKLQASLSDQNPESASKGDITEELVRLGSHIAEAERALKGRECGKRLEFLLQEMLRESNTMASKAQDSVVQTEVVGLKVELEKVREQALNLE